MVAGAPAAGAKAPRSAAWVRRGDETVLLWSGG
jgi:hypothetical protein